MIFHRLLGLRPLQRPWIALACTVLLLYAAMPLGWAQPLPPHLESGETETELEGFTPVEALESPQTEHRTAAISDDLLPAPGGPVLRGRAEAEKTLSGDVLTDDVRTIPSGKILTMVMMDMVATGFNQAGDSFHARLKEPVTDGEQILVPKGTLVKGHLLATENPGRALAQSGKMTLVFDYILMPDGRRIALKSAYEKGDTALKAMGRAVGAGVGGTLAGAVRGVLVGLKVGGLGLASATNGATLIGGGGLGALAGLGGGLSRSGDHVLLNEGDEIKVALQETLQLPVLQLAEEASQEIHLPGLGVQVLDYTLSRDPFKVERQLNLKLSIDNQTPLTFGSFDVALVDEYNHTFAVSPFGNDSLLVFRIEPNRTTTGTLSFSVVSPELRHYLVFYKPYTRDVIAKISLSEALKSLQSGRKSNIRKSS